MKHDSTRLSIVISLVLGVVLRWTSGDEGTVSSARVTLENERTIARQNVASAETLSAEAEQLQKQGSGESLQQAIHKYQQALALYRQAGNKRGQAESLRRLGMCNHNLSRPRQAVEAYNLALPIWRELNDQKGVGDTLSGLGWTYQSLGEMGNALTCYDQALLIRREVGDKAGQAQTLNTIGSIRQELGEVRKAIEHYEQGLALSREVSNATLEAYSLNNLGGAYESLAEPQRAIEFIEQALKLWRSSGNRYGEAEAWNAAGRVHSLSRDPQASLSAYNRALAIWQETGFRLGEGQALNNIGTVYYIWIDYTTAEELYKKALDIFVAVGSRLDEAKALSNLAMVYSRTDRNKEAFEICEQTLKLYRSVGNKFGEASVLNAIGCANARSGDFEKGISMFSQAARLFESGGHAFEAGAALLNIGMVRLQQNDPGGAIQAVNLVERYKTTPLFHGTASRLLALANLRLGNLTEARNHIQQALEAHTYVRDRILRDDFLLTDSLPLKENYKVYTSILMQLDLSQSGSDYSAQAIQANEESRARVLLQRLGDGRTEIRRGISPSLASQETAARGLVNAKAERLTRLAMGKHADGHLEQARYELTSALDQHQAVLAEIKAQSPGYAALTQPRAVTADEIQRQILDNETLLLEYSLGDDESYLWVVSKGSLSSFRLARREEIERAARRYVDLLRLGARVELRTQLDLAAAELSRLILQPAAHLLGKQRLAIVADGVLDYVPFASLPVTTMADGRPGAGKRSTTRRAPAMHRVLIKDHEIVSLPSASVVAELRRAATGRTPAAKTVAVFADPVLESTDPRVTAVTPNSTVPALPSRPPSAAIQLGRDLKRSAADLDLISLERLTYTRKEADSITSMTPPGASLRAVDFDASREAALSPSIADYRIVHFASHSLLNSRHPELSGIVLSLVDEKGQSQNGFLRLNDIYNMTLGADLVVLSACKTALGKEVYGEGLVGITRGFMYAGAPRVVASLWDVKDEATAELMKRFYHGMLKDNLRPAAALRAAQLSMLNEKRWESPYYWSGFVLQGEWK